MEKRTDPSTMRSGFLAIVGKPNVGKSTLLNGLVGQKVAIVSARPQTTRNTIRGVLTEGDSQLVFLDTPGLHSPRTKLGEYMVREVNDSMAGLDAALFVVEPSARVNQAEETLLTRFPSLGCPVYLVINKVDTVTPDKIAAAITLYSSRYSFEDVLPISALNPADVDLVRGIVLKAAKPGPWYFPADMVTDQPERRMVAEIIREKALRFLQDEVPHGIGVDIETFDESNPKLIRIGAVIVCERDAHKGIIIGKGGAMLKKILTSARHDIETLLDAKVFLEAFVKVRDNWRDSTGRLRELGYDK